MSERKESPAYTETERKVLGVLRDGGLHTVTELHAVLPDELGPLRNVRSHVYNLRAKLRPAGRDIESVFRGGTFYYRLVRLSVS